MNQIMIRPGSSGPVIAPELHSQFIEFLGTCISEGIWVGKDSPIPNIDGMRKAVVEALAALQPPVIRWPGGCYADAYHWRDGVGPDRKVTWNENFGTYARETNEFGTDEFLRFCELVGAKPWLNVNLMTGSTREMVEWAEYCNRREETDLSRERAANGHPEPYNVELWGIGNEVWCGGGYYIPETYAAEYRKYATAMPSFRPSGPPAPGEEFRIKLIASGPDGNKPKERAAWTRDLFRAFARYRMPKLDAIDLHFYNWNLRDFAKPETEFGPEDWYSVLHGALELEEVIREQVALIEEGLGNLPKPEGDLPGGGAPRCKLVVGEWGNWHGAAFRNRPALYQQCTMRDALTTAITLDIFHRNCAVIDLACVAQTVNVLNSLILTEGEHTILTPNYHVFMMYKPHRGGRLLDLQVETEQIGVTPGEQVDRVYALASEKEGTVTANLINTHLTEETAVTLALPAEYTYLGGQVLRGQTPDACNTPEHPAAIVPTAAAAPTKDGDGWTVTLPAASVTVLQFRK